MPCITKAPLASGAFSLMVVAPLPIPCPRKRGEGKDLERDLVVELLVKAALGRGLAAAARRIRVAALRPAVIRLAVLLHAGARTSGAPVEHGEIAVEALQHDLGGITILSVLA